MSAVALQLAGLSFRYGSREALSDISLQIDRGEIFGLLGPNGGGKTTLFRLLSTLIPLQTGTASICGFDLATQPSDVRRKLGVTFQSPSLDGRLTVRENLSCQGMLYGLSGRVLRRRIADLLKMLCLEDRETQPVETLSGGLKRRVEIAKSMLHEPEFLLLDEPSTGLDPNARLNLWDGLEQLRVGSEITIFVTTHLMDEAERCDRIAILDRGSLVVNGSPDRLRESIGGDCVVVRSKDVKQLQIDLRDRFCVDSELVGDGLRFESTQGHEIARRIADELSADILNISIGRPTLEDVFVRHTGRQFREVESE